MELQRQQQELGVRRDEEAKHHQAQALRLETAEKSVRAVAREVKGVAAFKPELSELQRTVHTYMRDVMDRVTAQLGSLRTSFSADLSKMQSSVQTQMETHGQQLQSQVTASLGVMIPSVEPRAQCVALAVDSAIGVGALARPLAPSSTPARLQPANCELFTGANPSPKTGILFIEPVGRWSRLQCLADTASGKGKGEGVLLNDSVF